MLRPDLSNNKPNLEPRPKTSHNSRYHVMRHSPPKTIPTLLESQRTILRPFQLQDADAAHRWFSDPLAMRFTPTGPDTNIEGTRARLVKYIAHQTERGFSKWIVLDRASLEPIGDSGILWLEEFHSFELGYRLRSDYWGKGFATEIAKTWVASAPAFGLSEIGAFAHIENVPSHAVLRKAGFAQIRQATVMGMDSLVFHLSF